MKPNSKGSETQAKNEKSPSKQENRRRRTRNDFSNRNFMCGCGKSYLSYPALYTHLKQKHNGIQPSGTILPHVKFSSRAKNPQKSNNSNVSNSKPEISNESYTGNSSVQDEEEGLKDFIRFFERYNLLNPKEEKTAELETPVNKTKENRSLKNFPKDFFEKEDDFKKILSNLEEIEKSTKGLPPVSNDKNKRKNELPTNCNKIFAKFLFEIARHLKPEWYKEVVLFVCLFRKTLNMIGWKTLNRPMEEEKEFCEANTAENVLDCCNEFITNILPNILGEFESLELEFLGKEEEGIKNAIFFTQFLGNWLFSNGYTTIKIKKNYEDPE